MKMQMFSACGERRYAVGRCDRVMCRRLGKRETGDLLWRPLKGEAEKKRRSGKHKYLCRYFNMNQR